MSYNDYIMNLRNKKISMGNIKNCFTARILTAIAGMIVTGSEIESYIVNKMTTKYIPLVNIAKLSQNSAIVISIIDKVVKQFGSNDDLLNDLILDRICDHTMYELDLNVTIDNSELLFGWELTVKCLNMTYYIVLKYNFADINFAVDELLGDDNSEPDLSDNIGTIYDNRYVMLENPKDIHDGDHTLEIISAKLLSLIAKNTISGNTKKQSEEIVKLFTS
jgi:hypothetical protein